MYFLIYQDKSREWRWALYEGDQFKLAESAESFLNHSDCRRAINAVRKSFNASIRDPVDTLAEYLGMTDVHKSHAF
jgi:uncharacterized protein YegP (UPF0339 family)